MNKGYFGDYGGLFIPETLSHALNELEKLYTEIKDDKDFNLQLTNIYRDYVGRPSPLYFAESLTNCLLYTSPSPRDMSASRMPSSA